MSQPNWNPYPQSLQYAQPIGVARPGILTAMGVLAILFGAVGILVNCVMAGQVAAFGYLMTNLPAIQQQVSMLTRAPADVSAIQTQLVGNATLSQQRAQNLKYFLAEPDASSMFQVAGASVTISEQPFGAAQHRSAEDRDVFATPAGELHVLDDCVIWMPAGVSQNGALESREVQTVLGKIVESLSGQLDSTQRNILLREFSRDDQALIKPGLSEPGMAISSAMPTLADALVIQTASKVVLYLPANDPTQVNPFNSSAVPVNTNTVIMGPGGTKVISSTPATQPATAPTTVPSTLPAFNNPFGGISRWAIALTLAEALLSLLLSIFLIAIGIGVFALWRQGRRMFLWYAWGKLALVALSIVAWAYFAWHLARSLSVVDPTLNPTVGAISAPFLGTTSFLALFSAAFPIGVLIVMRSGKVRDYYAHLGG